MKQLLPESLPAPFARYAHGVFVPPNHGFVFSSGQLGIGKDGVIPDSVLEQAHLCFEHCRGILTEGGMTAKDVVRINAFVTDRGHMAGYMEARDAFCAEMTRLPASTLVIVSGFTRPEFKVEVEVTAARDMS